MDAITNKIWIGNHLDAKNRNAIVKTGIQSILCLDSSVSTNKAEDVGVTQLKVVDLIDGAGNPPEKFLRAVQLLKELVKDSPPVLVHCHAGQSRSAAVVCKYFMQEEGNALAEAMQRITSKRKVSIISGLQEALDF